MGEKHLLEKNSDEISKVYQKFYQFFPFTIGDEGFNILSAAKP